METAAAEHSPAPSTSTNKLKAVFSKARRGTKDNGSSLSINEADSTASGSRGIRASFDATIDKIKTRGSGEHDDAESSGSGGIAKLIPGRSKKNRRRREAEAEAAQQEAEELRRGRSIGDRGGVGGNGLGTALDAGAAGPDTLEGDDDGSSLITYDSDIESRLASPPPLVSHDSHTGYLTSSSPLIKTTAPEASDGSSAAVPRLDAIDETPSPPQFKATTFPITSSNTSLDTNLAPRHATTFEPPQGESQLLSAEAGEKGSRDVSPATRIKDVFTPSFRRKGTSPNTSPERASVKSSSSGNALSGIFSTSLSSRRASKVSENPPNLPQPIQTDSTRPKPTGAKLVSLETTPKTPKTPKTPISASLQTPFTTVTPPTPTDRQPVVPTSPSRKSIPAPNADMDSNTVTSPSGIMISHRRIRSDSATHPHSKLSSFTSAPLTPTIEEGRTSGGRTASGTQGSPGGAGGFFSSVFSAAQNAANTLSNTIANNQTRSRSSTQDSEMDENNGVDEPTAVVPQVEPGQMNQQRQLAVETLGSGDLSLSHLGISSDTLASHPDGVSAAQRDEAAARAEHISAARAVSAAYSEKPHDDGTAASIGGDTAVSVRPGSTYESSMAEEKTPPNGSVFEGNHGPRRSGSVRSRVGGVVRRHRNNSNATGTTIGAAIGAGHAALANPTANSSVPKLTGFAVASKKRNRDFHQLFRSVPEDDYLIEDYSCALQRDIILAGRIYVSEGHICFSSNILGWVTTLIISFDEVVSIEKESTAVVFPNAIAIQTLHARHTFRSLLSREATYELMVGIWKINHPSLKSSLNGVRLVEGGTGDKTEKVEPSGSEGGSDDSDDDDGIYDEDEDDEGDGSFIEAGDGSIAGSEAGDSIIKSESRKTSAVGVAAGMAAGSVPTAPPAKAGEKASAAATTAAVDFPGPTSHAPTECGDADTHYDIVIGDEVIAAPLGKVYSMMFGPASGGFLSRWLLDEQRVTELQMEDDKKGLSDEVRSRSYSYIKPLSGPIGPKQTKCLINETIEAFDLEKAITITSSTQTPDVPSGNVFSTKTKYCLTWAPGNSTRVQMNCMIEWTGKSWLKNPIEKGAKDGQLAYATDLIKALKLGISSRPRAGTSASKSKLRTKRGKNSLSTSKPSTASSSASPQKKEDSWGLLEPLHGPLGPVVDILHPLVSANTVIAFLLFLLLISWFRGSRARAPTGSADAGVGFAGSSTPERVAAYEEIWRREESELWDWMEERVGMRGGLWPGGGADPGDAAYLGGAGKQGTRMRMGTDKGVGKGGQRVLEAKEMEKRLEEGGMGWREVDEAIRVTEERLEALRGVVGRRKREEAGGGGGEEGEGV